MERARAFAPPAGRSRGECGGGIALTRSPARPKIGAVHRGGGETSGSSSLGKQDRRAGDEIVPMHPRWERIFVAKARTLGSSACTGRRSHWFRACGGASSTTRRSRDRSPERSSGGRARPPARARSASLSRFGGSTTSMHGSPSHTFAALVVSQIAERVDAADHHHEPVRVRGAVGIAALSGGPGLAVTRRARCSSCCLLAMKPGGSRPARLRLRTRSIGLRKL